ncbi:MAG: hypothetical protein IPM82_05615 [Saprospiraceae bacterium]|nr:hypothetical protein [Saprospiraceae bacterium]
MATTRTLHIHKLKEDFPNLSPIQCDYYAESCVIALENQGHRTGVSLKVEGDMGASFELNWQPVAKLGGWQEPRDVAENDAIAISFLLVADLTDYQVVEQAVIGTGFDYWLGHGEGSAQFDPDNYLNATLEVSGINKGSRGKMSQRIKQRLRRVGLSNSMNIPSFIIVTEFGEPISIIIEK